MRSKGLLAPSLMCLVCGLDTKNPELFDESTILSFKGFVDGDIKMMLCPVKAIKHHMTRKDQYSPVYINFIISTESKKCVTKNTISFWLRSV